MRLFVFVLSVVAALSCVVALTITFLRKREAKTRPSTASPGAVPGPDRLTAGFSKAHVVVFQSFFIAFTVLELTKVIFGIDLVALLRHWVGQ